MTTMHVDSHYAPAPDAQHRLPAASTVAAAIAFLVCAGIVAQAANPLTWLVGMTPIAWVAIEGAWRLFR